jgi:hypothetical protein
LEYLIKSETYQREVKNFEFNKIKLKNKAIEILNIINQETIDTKILSRYVFTGIPHHNEDLIGLRPIVWRIILGALPNKTKDW